jgi:uncharacterized protein (DUF1800 family)
MRMLCTQRPLQERLTLFWHNHFAVSDGKVEDGPMMLTYLNTLRDHAAGKFVDLLQAVSKDPAMMRYLDMQRSIRGHPNENFAREVMELFTLGIGNYTEDDVKAASRALTGWGYLNIFYELPGNTESKLRDWITIGRPFSTFTLMPAMHDPGPHTLLGVTGDIDGDKALEIMAHHQVTAKRTCKKIWEHFAYENPEDHVVERLARTYTHTNGDIRAVFHDMVGSSEFWSENCVRKLVKSPVDLFVTLERQMGAGSKLMSMRDPHATPETPISQDVMNMCGSLANHMERCGLSLMYPPDVSGWRWGQNWISSAAMLERIRYHGDFIYSRVKGQTNSGTATTLAFVTSKAPKNSLGISEALAEYFDAPIPEDSVAVLAQEIDKRGGLQTLKDNVWPGTLDRSLELLIATPEMQMR